MVVGLIAPREEIRTNKTDREGEIDKEREREGHEVGNRIASVVIESPFPFKCRLYSFISLGDQSNAICAHGLLLPTLTDRPAWVCERFLCRNNYSSSPSVAQFTIVESCLCV